MTVCDDCLTEAYDEGVSGYKAQASMMIDIGAEWKEHECVELQLDGEIRCDCGCYGQEKQRLRAAS